MFRSFRYSLFLLLLSVCALLAQPYAPPYVVEHFAGLDPVNNGPATLANLDGPVGLTFDADGNLLIAERTAGLIRRLRTNGMLETAVGSRDGVIATDGALAAEAWLVNPFDVAVHPMNGSVYFADGNAQTVFRVDAQGVIRRVAGDRTPGFSGDGGPATEARLSGPEGIAFDSNGNLFIADEFNNRIRRVDAAGIITTIAGTGVAGFSGDGGPATAAQLADPSDLDFDAQGRLLFTDTSNWRVRRIELDGTINTVAGNADGFYSADGVPATSTGLSVPVGVAVGPDGSFYIADRASHRVRKVAPDGIIRTIAGTGEFAGDGGGFGGDGGPGPQAVLSNPEKVAVDSAGNVYFSDNRNDRIRRVAVDGTITTVAGRGRYHGDNGPAAQAGFLMPTSIDFDPSGNLFVADSDNHVARRIDPAGAITTVAGTGLRRFTDEDSPTGLAQGMTIVEHVAVDRDGNLFIADLQNRKVRRLTPAGDLSLVAGNGRTSGSGDGGPAKDAELNEPVSLAVDRDGNVFIVIIRDNRVRVVDTAGGIRAFAGTGDRGFSGDGGPATAATLSGPLDVEVDDAGNVYVAASGRIRRIIANGNIDTLFTHPGTASGFTIGADGAFYIFTFEHRVLRWTPGTGVVTIAGSERGYSGDGGPALAAKFWNRDGGDLVVGADRRIFITDTNNHVIRVLVPGPRMTAEGFLHAASFVGQPFAAGSIISVFGLNLAPELGVATATPLPLTLVGTSITVTDSMAAERDASLFFVSQTQANLLIPVGTATGTAKVTVKDAFGGEASAEIQIVSVAPGLFTANANGQGVAAGSWVRGESDGSQTSGPLFSRATNTDPFGAAPINISGEGTQVFVLLFGTGIRNRSDLSAVSATVGGQPVGVTFAGAQGTFVGLDQLNIGPLPPSLLGAGEVEIRITVDGQVANIVKVAIQ